MHVIVICKFHEDPTKMKNLRCSATFSHSKPMGHISCHSNQCSEAIFLICICKQSPTKDMLQIKFGWDLLAGCKDIPVRKCAWRRMTDDGFPRSLRLRWAKQPRSKQPQSQFSFKARNCSCILAKDLKGTDILSGGNYVKIRYVPFWKEFYSSGKELSPQELAIPF